MEGHTFIYNFRIRDLYKRTAVSLAVLADDNPDWYVSVFDKLWGCLTVFRFPIVKILEYREKLEKSDNPFAVVVMVHLKTMETKGDDSTRKWWKTELTKNLYRRGFEKQDIINLYRFIDWIMLLPAKMENAYHHEIMEFEEEEKMRYVTTAERIGMEKGRIEGKIEGKIEGSLKKATKTAKNLLSFNVLTLEQIAQATGLTPEEVRELHKSLKCGNA